MAKPKLPLKGPGPGRLPELKGLKDKAPAEILRTLERLHLEPDMAEIGRRARRVFEQQIGPIMQMGAVPDRAAWEAIDKQVERALTDVLRQQTKQAIHNYRADQLKDVAEKFVWIAVGDGSCPSCEERHGKSRTLREWDREGGPGSPVLICKSECRCSLQPDFMDEDTADIVERAVDAGLAGLRGRVKR